MTPLGQPCPLTDAEGRRVTATEHSGVRHVGQLFDGVRHLAGEQVALGIHRESDGGVPEAVEVQNLSGVVRGKQKIAFSRHVRSPASLIQAARSSRSITATCCLSGIFDLTGPDREGRISSAGLHRRRQMQLPNFATSPVAVRLLAWVSN